MFSVRLRNTREKLDGVWDLVGGNRYTGGQEGGGKKEYIWRLGCKTMKSDRRGRRRGGVRHQIDEEGGAKQHRRWAERGRQIQIDVADGLRPKLGHLMCVVVIMLPEIDGTVHKHNAEKSGAPRM